MNPDDEKSLFSRFRMIEEQESVCVLVLDDKIMPLMDLQKYNRRQTQKVKGRKNEEEVTGLKIHEMEHKRSDDQAANPTN